MASLGLKTPASAVSPADRLDTLPAWPWDDPYDKAAPLTLGYWAIGWAQEFLVQPNGEKAGEPFRLTDRQKRFLLWWYAMDEDGRWLFSHGARRMAKGSGKSPFAAVLALTDFCGPVRLDRKDDRLPGRVKGKPVAMPWVQISATAHSQTKNTMRMIRAFAPKGSYVVDAHNLDVGKSVYYKLPEGTLEVTTSSFAAVEGSEPSLVIGDETELWLPARRGDDLAETHEDNLAKSGSRMLETSNAWKPGIESVAEATWDAWVAQEESRLGLRPAAEAFDERAGQILYDAVIAPPDTDLRDYDSLKAALDFVYEDAWWSDTTSIIKRIWSPKAKPAESKRKYLNWPTADEEAWVEPEDWKRLADPDVKVEKGDRIVLFFDGSKSRDATALIGCRVSDGHVFTLGVWEPDPNDPDDTVDVDSVDSAVIKAFEKYQVAAFFADVREWESYALSEWPNRYKDDLEVWAVPSGKPAQPIAWDMRSNTIKFAEAAEATLADIEDEAFTHDGDSRTGRHVANMRNREYKGRMSVGKESPNSPKKIDAGVCVIGARMVRRLVPPEPPKQRSGLVG